MATQLDRWLARNGSPDDLSTEERREFFNSMPESIRREWDLRKAKQQCEVPSQDYNQAVVERARKRMSRVDAMSPAIRRLVHEYGLEIVHVFLENRVPADKIAFLIDTVRNADYPNGQARFKFNKGPNAKQNPINQYPSDDDFYYVPRAAR